MNFQQVTFRVFHGRQAHHPQVGFFTPFYEKRTSGWPLVMQLLVTLTITESNTQKGTYTMKQSSHALCSYQTKPQHKHKSNPVT